MRTSIFSFLIGMATLMSCSNQPNNNAPAQPETAAAETFALDGKAADQEHITYGKASMQTFTDIVKANGSMKNCGRPRRRERLSLRARWPLLTQP